VESVITLLGLILLFVFCLLGLLSLVVGLPGTLIIVTSALVYAWLTSFSVVAWSTIGWLAGMAVFAEGIEFAAASVSAAGTRPSRRVTVAVIGGGLVGGIIGTPFLFGVGSLFGALLGAFSGAVLAVASEGGTVDHAFRTGLAAMTGRLLGFVIKATIAVLMIVVLAAAVL
jgi:uncharacterized protein YqgC (DUF456 family)